MNMHKNTRLTPHHRQAIWTAYTQEKESVTSLARRTKSAASPSIAHLRPQGVGCSNLKPVPTIVSNRQSTE